MRWRRPGGACAWSTPTGPRRSRQRCAGAAGARCCTAVTGRRPCRPARRSSSSASPTRICPSWPCRRSCTRATSPRWCAGSTAPRPWYPTPPSSPARSRARWTPRGCAAGSAARTGFCSPSRRSPTTWRRAWSRASWWSGCWPRWVRRSGSAAARSGGRRPPARCTARPRGTGRARPPRSSRSWRPRSTPCWPPARASRAACTHSAARRG
jgi:hypothetical protein